jgi:hypothetical protein
MAVATMTLASHTGSDSEQTPNASNEDPVNLKPYRSYPWPAWAATVVGVVAAATVLSWVLGSLVPLAGLLIFAGGGSLRNQGLARAMSHSSIWTIAALLTISILGSRWNFLTAPAIVAAILGGATILLGILAFRPTLPRWPRAQEWPWTVLVGPALLLIALAAFTLRFGSLPAWAMSGDARNHLFFIDEVREAGGWDWTLDSYPGGFNALVALLTLPADEAAGAGAILEHRINGIALLLVLILGLFGLLAGLVARGPRGGWGSHLRGAAGSFLLVTPLALTQVFSGGFFPIPLAWLVGLSGLYLLASDRRCLGWPVVTALATSVLLLMNVPQIAPLPAMAWLMLAASRVTQPRLRLVSYIGLGTLGLIAARGLIEALGERYPNQLRALVADGYVEQFSPWLLLAVTVIAAVSLALYRGAAQVQITAIVIAGSALTWVICNWIVSLRGEWSYYSTKALWIAVVALLPLAISRAFGAERDGLRRSTVPVALLLIVTCVPLLLFNGRVASWNPLLRLPIGWIHPDHREAATVIWLADRSPAFVWKLNEPEEDRKINIWSSYFLFPVGEAQSASQPATWSYSPDTVKPSHFCWLFQAYPDVKVYADDEAEAEQLRTKCGVGEESVPLLPPDAREEFAP